MYDAELVREILTQVLTAIERIDRRSDGIISPNDFVSSEHGTDMLDAISMMLIAIGESFKKVDKVTGESLLSGYPDIDWKGVKGIRDIISHHYFDISAEIVFNVCKKHIPSLKSVCEKMIRDL